MDQRFKTVNISSSSLFLVIHERLDGWSTGHPGRLQQSRPLSAMAESNFGLLVSSPSPHCHLMKNHLVHHRQGLQVEDIFNVAAAPIINLAVWS